MNERNKVLSRSNEKIIYSSSNLLSIIESLLAKGANKKICSLLLSLTLSATTPVASFANLFEKDYGTLAATLNGINNGVSSDGKIKSFSDVTQNHWAFEAISKLQSIGAIDMTADTNFIPGKAITREEFVMLLAKSLGFSTAEVTTKFLDVHISRPSNPYINLFVRDGIIAGISDRRFDPDTKINREQAAAIIIRALNKYFAGEIKTTSKVFKDNELISNWARPSVQNAIAMNIFSGYTDGRFGPKLSITKAEAAKIILELRNLVKGNDIAMPVVSGTALTLEKELNNNGIFLGDWELEDYGNLTDKYIAPDNVTRRIVETYPTSLVIAAPLTGKEKWSNWYVWAPGFEPYSNGTFKELSDKGIILIEEKTIVDESGNSIVWMRDKTNIVHEVGPMLYGYEVRRIVDLKGDDISLNHNEILNESSDKFEEEKPSRLVLTIAYDDCYFKIKPKKNSNEDTTY
mgnify:CR=1 FL=1